MRRCALCLSLRNSEIISFFLDTHRYPLFLIPHLRNVCTMFTTRHQRDAGRVDVVDSDLVQTNSSLFKLSNKRDYSKEMQVLVTNCSFYD